VSIARRGAHTIPSHGSRTHYAAASRGSREDKSLTMAPSRLSEFITLVRDRFEQAAREGGAPVLVTSPGGAPVRALDRGALP